MAKDRREPELGNVHFVAGLSPLTPVVLVHVANLTRLLWASEDHITLTTTTERALSWAWLELGVFGLALLVHVFRALRKNAEPAESTPRSRAMHRVSGFAAAFYVLCYLLEFPARTASGELAPADATQDFVRALSSTSASGIPVAAALYLLGLGVTIFHVCHAAYRLALTHADARRARRRARLAVALGVAAFALASQSVVYCATGSHWFFFG